MGNYKQRFPGKYTHRKVGTLAPEVGVVNGPRMWLQMGLKSGTALQSPWQLRESGWAFELLSPSVIGHMLSPERVCNLGQCSSPTWRQSPMKGTAVSLGAVLALRRVFWWYFPGIHYMYILQIWGGLEKCLTQSIHTPTPALRASINTSSFPFYCSFF